MNLKFLPCILYAAFSVLIDVLFFSQRCVVSPPVSPLFAFALVIQIAAIALAYWSAFIDSTRFKSHLIQPIFWPALMLIIASYPAAENSIKFSDKIGHVNGYKSVGLQCSLPNPSFKRDWLKPAP
jgi:hypothetical protein